MVVVKDTNELVRRARDLVIGGGQGHKRGSDIPGYPRFAVRGKGVRFWDDQGREFIDYLCAFGPILLGHAHPKVDAAVKKQIDEGVIFNIPHPLEADLAEKLIKLIPCAEMVSYFTGGSGATTGAVYVARACTGKPKVVRCGYHGWHDWCQVGRGYVPEAVRALTIEMKYDDLDNTREIFREHGKEIACIIMEPIFRGRPSDGYLEELKAICEKHGALLIFDEVKTGFRYSLGGAQEWLGVTPHLATFGKAMANGYDIGVLVGSKAILGECADVWLAATFHAHLTGIAASLATIKEMEETDGIGAIWRQGQKLMDGLDEIARRHSVDAHCEGFPPMPILRFSKDAEDIANRFWAGTAKRGVYFSPGHVWFISPAHDDATIRQTLAASDEAMTEAVRV